MQIGVMPIAMPISNWPGLFGQCCVATLNVGKNADRNETEEK
jgi:hypothetical protein